MYTPYEQIDQNKDRFSWTLDYGCYVFGDSMVWKNIIPRSSTHFFLKKQLITLGNRCQIWTYLRLLFTNYLMFRIKKDKIEPRDLWIELVDSNSYTRGLTSIIANPPMRSSQPTTPLQKPSLVLPQRQPTHLRGDILRHVIIIRMEIFHIHLRMKLASKVVCLHHKLTQTQFD